MSDTVSHPRSHPRPRPGDAAAFVYEKDGKTYEGRIFFGGAREVVFAFNGPKAGIKNDNPNIPYQRIVTIGEGGHIKEPILWFDADDFFLTERDGEKIYYPGDTIYISQFDREFRVLEVVGDVMMCSSNGIMLTFLQPSLQD